MFQRFTKQRSAKQFNYIPRYGDDKKFNMIYRSIGRINYAESYANKKFDYKKNFIMSDDIYSNQIETKNTEKRIQFKRSEYNQYNSTKTLILILVILTVIVIALFGFDLTLFY